MPRQVVLYKRKRDSKQRCTTFRIDQPSYKFTLETCDNLIAEIRDNRNNLVAGFDVDHPALVSKIGVYNVCIIGDGVGTAYVEWTSDSAIDERCCQEVQEYLTTYIDEKIISTRVSISKGDNITIVENGNDYKISAKDTVTTLLQGSNITITDSGTNGNHIYTIACTASTGTLQCCEELNNRIDNINITGGTGINVTKNGDNYTIINTDPGSGVSPNIDIKGGTNVQVNKSGNTYTISATGSDTNTITTLTPGTGVTISDSGTGGNHNYTISATSTGNELPSDFNIKGGTNVQVNKSGNTYTISATDTNTDTITTVKQGTNVTVVKNGNEYTVSANDTDTKPVLVQALTVTCDIGGIASGTVYPVGTLLEKILRDLLTCTSTPPNPTKQYPWFTSRVVNRTGWVEEWDEFAVDPSAGSHTFDVAQTFEDCPVKFDVPASLAPLMLELYNQIFARWEVNTHDFAITNITRTIDGENVAYLRYTDAREATAASRPVRMTWNFK